MFCISRRTVYRIIQRFQATGSIENLPASGRPQLMSARDERSLIRSVKNNRSTPLKEITAKFNENGNRAVSKRTVQRVLFKAGYHRRVSSHKKYIHMLDLIPAKTHTLAFVV